MSDMQQGPGWWMASDGKWYPPESRAQPLPPPPWPSPPGGAGPTPVMPGAGSPPGVVPSAPPGPYTPPGYAPVGYAPAATRSLSTGLGGTIQGFFWAVAATALVSGVLALASLLAFNSYWDTPINSRAEAQAYDDWVAVDDGFASFAAFAFLFGFVLWILLMVWMNSAHKTTQQLWHGERRWSSGWTVGSWFIPVASAVIPKLVLSEIERIAFAPRSNGVVHDTLWRARSTLVVGRLWWVALVVGIFATSIGGSVGTDSGSSAGEIRAGYICNAVGLLLLALSSVCGALYVRRLGARLSAAGLREPV